MLQRMRDLAVQSANDTLGTGERMNIGQELDALRSRGGQRGHPYQVQRHRPAPGQRRSRHTAGTDAEIQVGQNLTAGPATITAMAAGHLRHRRQRRPRRPHLQVHRHGHRADPDRRDHWPGPHPDHPGLTAQDGDRDLRLRSLGMKLTFQRRRVRRDRCQPGHGARLDTGKDQPGRRHRQRRGLAAVGRQQRRHHDRELRGHPADAGTKTEMTDVYTLIGTFAAAGGAGATQSNASTHQQAGHGARLHVDRAREVGCCPEPSRVQHLQRQLAGQQPGGLEQPDPRRGRGGRVGRHGPQQRPTQAGVSVLSQANQIPQLALKLLG